MSTTYTYGGGMTTGGKGGNGSSNRPSNTQLGFYFDLCRTRNVPPKDTTKLSYDDVSALIQELRAYVPASIAQKNKIIDLCKEMSMDMPDDLDKMTGGQNGTASLLIGELMKKRQKMTETLPPSEAQIRFLLNMFPCPDCNFEEINIPTKIVLDETFLHASGEMRNKFRAPTPEETVSNILTKVTRSQASAFLDKHRMPFNTWNQTRCTEAQRKLIRDKEARMANLYTPKEIEKAAGIDGHEVSDSAEVSRATYLDSWKGYEQLDELQLLQFTVQQAETYINQLDYEFDRIRNGKLDADVAKDDPDFRRLANPTELQETHEMLRTSQTRFTYNVREFEKLNNILHALCAIGGIEDPDLVNSTYYVLDGDDKDATTTNDASQKRKYIKSFMLELVEHGDIDYSGLVELCKECDAAMEILVKG